MIAKYFKDLWWVTILWTPRDAGGSQAVAPQPGVLAEI